MNDEVLEEFHPKIATFIAALQNNSDIGVLGGHVQLAEPRTSCNSIDGKKMYDRIQVNIPFATSHLSWQVLFNSMHPEDPPDFIFAPADSDFVPRLDEIKSLVNWDPDDPLSLKCVISELVDMYKAFQVEEIKQHTRLQFEYSSLINTGKFTEMEIHMPHRRLMQSWETMVKFLIRLPVDFSEIPEYFTKKSPGQDLAILVVTYQNHGEKVYPQLYLSPGVEHALGGASSLRIPVYPSDGFLFTYVPQVCELLENMIELVAKGFKKRKEYIAAFLSHYGRSVLEYDAESFDTISFLFENQDFHFILHIYIPTYFPKEQPEFAFQSVYHTTSSGRPFTQTVKDYPYSPRWSGNEMAARAKIFMEEFITDFKRAAVTSGYSR
ncbi:BRISC and BRCA1-A complex member 2 [Holothuria leucospilota]|uniref:BRISC and BRCA1-A complex member 2 n=1 Tax=Holothuria leucospilota TaxID=206669 RepID=A0A9Q1CGC4_HOLLE|nr:BRISC and BRCA1-A complex member 2 [Holothuria leucospilota]